VEIYGRRWGILYLLLYPPAKKFRRIWERFREHLSVVLPLKNQVRALERKWAYSLGDHCERDVPAFFNYDLAQKPGPTLSLRNQVI